MITIRAPAAIRAPPSTSPVRISNSIRASGTGRNDRYRNSHAPAGASEVIRSIVPFKRALPAASAAERLRNRRGRVVRTGRTALGAGGGDLRRDPPWIDQRADSSGADPPDASLHAADARPVHLHRQRDLL